MKTLIALAAAVILIGSGCRFPFMYYDWRAYVRSDTIWEGNFNGMVVRGYGDSLVDLRDDGVVCIIIRKLTGPGTLSLKVNYHDGQTTTEPFDTLYDCER